MAAMVLRWLANNLGYCAIRLINGGPDPKLKPQGPSEAIRRLVEIGLKAKAK
jgi:hypothetical protein